MQRFRLKKVTATRTLSLAPDEAGPATKVVVVFATPTRIAKSTDYVCYYRIEGLSCAGTRKAFGVDSVQALLLAFVNAASTLYASEEHKAGRLKYFDDRNLGLPAYEKYFSESVSTPGELFFM